MLSPYLLGYQEIFDPIAFEWTRQRTFPDREGEAVFRCRCTEVGHVEGKVIMRFRDRIPHMQYEMEKVVSRLRQMIVL